jgi:putative transcriptional regulator
MAGPSKSWQGQLLLDGGKLHDSIFHRAVVLICQHDAGGAFGLILNRPAGSKVGDAVVANLPQAVKEQPLFIGGPVQPGVLSFLHSDLFVPHANVMPELNLGHSIETLMDLSESYSPTQKLRLFAGYAGWSAGQLEQEMARHDWLTHPATVELVFGSDPAQLWKEILRQKDPALRWLADSPENLSWN